METQTKSRAGRTVAILLVMSLILGATVAYYNSVLSQQVADSNSSNSSLQNQISTLKTEVASLSSMLSSFSGNQSSASAPDGTALSIYGNASKSVVTIEGDVATTINTFFGPITTYSHVEGSGFAIDYQNAPYIITNFHVVDGTTNMTITFSNGDAYRGSVVGSDVYADLAVVSVKAPPFEFFPLGLVDSSVLRVGQPVYAIGAPFGLSGTFTSGLISQLGRTIQEATAGNYSISGIVQFTAPINPGNSGGPLLDSGGHVVGITTATISGSQGLGFAIPSRSIIRELSSLMATGSYKGHSYLGIGGADMNLQLAEASKANVTYGVLVESVAGGSPAAKAGLKGGTTQIVVSGARYLVGGSIVISVNGTRIIGMDALSSYLEENTVAGQKIVLDVVQGGSTSFVTVTLGARG